MFLLWFHCLWGMGEGGPRLHEIRPDPNTELKHLSAVSIQSVRGDFTLPSHSQRSLSTFVRTSVLHPQAEGPRNTDSKAGQPRLEGGSRARPPRRGASGPACPAGASLQGALRRRGRALGQSCHEWSPPGRGEPGCARDAGMEAAALPSLTRAAGPSSGCAVADRG